MKGPHDCVRIVVAYHGAGPVFGFRVVSALNVETLFDFVGMIGNLTTASYWRLHGDDSTPHGRYDSVTATGSYASKHAGETTMPKSSSIYVKNYSQL
jgi:hypothetical protein